jgi:diguanylate cyclase (GGDEF)-like protein
MAVLIVDDSITNRTFLRRLLGRQGLTEVDEAGSAEEAYELLDLDPLGALSRYELILMDIGLPGDDGVEACRRINAAPRLKDVPVLMVTACDEDQGLTAAFEAGAWDYVTRPFRANVLLARVDHALRYRSETLLRRRREEELLQAQFQLECVNNDLRHLAETDKLTGIPNRRAFEAALQSEWLKAHRTETALGLLLIDVDHFKLYNDAHGHVAGDECLREIAGAASKAIRDNDFVGRYGGEELICLLPRSSRENTLRVAERIRSSIECLERGHGARGAGRVVTVSVGAACEDPAVGCCYTSEGLLRAADQALYRAKKTGRNRVCLAEPQAIESSPAEVSPAVRRANLSELLPAPPIPALRQAQAPLAVALPRALPAER